MYKKYISKYGNGGDVMYMDPYQSISDNPIDLNEFTSASEGAGDFAFDAGGTDMITEQASEDLVGKLGDVTSAAMAAYEIGSDFKRGVEGYRDFYDDNFDPRTGFDRSEALKSFKEARAQKYGAGAEAAGFTLGTILTGGNVKAGRVVGNFAENVAERLSKFFGVSKKAQNQMDIKQLASLTYEQSVLADEAEMKQKEQRQETLSKYLTELSQPAQIAYAELGGMLYGPSHAEGGIPIEVEGGEFIVKKSAMSDDKVKTITGTNKQIASKINADAGGKNPFPGAKINMYG